MNLWRYVVAMGSAFVLISSCNSGVPNDKPPELPELGQAAAVASTAGEAMKSEKIRAQDAGATKTHESEVAAASPALGEHAALLSEDGELTQLYGALSVEQLEIEADGIREEIMEATQPLFRQRFDAGSYEVLDEGTDFNCPQTDQWKLVSYQSVPTGQGKQIRRAELLEAEYPELYIKVRKTRWLDEEVRRKRDELKRGTNHR